MRYIRKQPTLKFFFITILILLFFTGSLPSPAFASFTIQDEKKLGQKFYEEMKAKNLILPDPEISKYINELGRRICSQGEKAPFDFTFSIIKNPGINAFATPGGYVYIYTGLIKLTENENQLAGVLAHEIAHVKARHIAQSIAKAQKINIATLAAILAGVFLGGGGEGTAAITSFSMATASSLNLKYSREHEEEADRLGMSYLTAAGYNPVGMLDFLKIMRQYEFYSNSIPSYFLTHPGTGDRIRYLYGLQHTVYSKEGAIDILQKFKRIKTLVFLTENNLQANLRYFQGEQKNAPSDVNILYGLAITQSRIGDAKEAFETFRKALEYAPHDPDILRDMGISYFSIGKIESAIEALKKAYTLRPQDPDTLLYLGRSYETMGNYETALNFYLPYQAENPEDVDSYYHIAMTYGKMGQKGESHYNFGIYFKKQKKAERALFHFREALKYFPPNSKTGIKIQEEIDTIKE